MPDEQAARWTVCRYLLASAVLVFMKVDASAGKEMKIYEEEWERLMQSEAAWLGVSEAQVRCPKLLTASDALSTDGFKARDASPQRCAAAAGA